MDIENPRRTVKGPMIAELEPEAYEIAEMFWAMSASEQAVFLSEIGNLPATRLCFQLGAIKDSPDFDHSALTAMRLIGEYADTH